MLAQVELCLNPAIDSRAHCPDNTFDCLDGLIVVKKPEALIPAVPACAATWLWFCSPELWISSASVPNTLSYASTGYHNGVTEAQEEESQSFQISANISGILCSNLHARNPT